MELFKFKPVDEDDDHKKEVEHEKTVENKKMVDHIKMADHKKITIDVELEFGEGGY